MTEPPPQFPSAEPTASRRGALGGVVEAPQRYWTGEVIARLDWRKIVELARALAVTAGWEPGGTRISPDGVAEFGMTKGSAAAPARIWARLAPWNRWMATAKCIEGFAADVAAHKGVRGT